MAARGSQAKEIVIQKLLETFPDAFQYDKEVRIPVEENGEIVQIKVALTCAKVNVECGAKEVVPNAGVGSVKIDASSAEITPEEKAEVKDLINRLNL